MNVTVIKITRAQFFALPSADRRRVKKSWQVRVKGTDQWYPVKWTR